MVGFGQQTEAVHDENKADDRLGHPKVQNPRFQWTQSGGWQMLARLIRELGVVGVDDVHRKGHVKHVNKVHVPENVDNEGRLRSDEFLN